MHECLIQGHLIQILENGQVKIFVLWVRPLTTVAVYWELSLQFPGRLLNDLFIPYGISLTTCLRLWIAKTSLI